LNDVINSLWNFVSFCLLYNSPLNHPRGTFESERPLGQGVARRSGVIIVDVPEFSKAVHLEAK